MTPAGDSPAARASDERAALLDAYGRWPDKGPERDGYRLTVLPLPPGGTTPGSTSVAVGETLRVAHVVESVHPDARLHVMGPKPVLGELVDGVPVTDPAPDGAHPLAPQTYNGRVLPGPGVDTAYDVTEHRFDAPGTHTVRWAPGGLASNVLTVEVR